MSKSKQTIKVGSASNISQKAPSGTNQAIEAQRAHNVSQEAGDQPSISVKGMKGSGWIAVAGVVVIAVLTTWLSMRG